MPESIRVTPEDLHMSAATVDVHADDVQARHFAADSRIEAARAGLPAGSVAALGTAVAKWQADTTALFGRMIDHAHGLRAGAAAYLQVDESGASDIKKAEQQVSELDLGL